MINNSMKDEEYWSPVEHLQPTPKVLEEISHQIKPKT